MVGNGTDFDPATFKPFDRQDQEIRDINANLDRIATALESIANGFEEERRKHAAPSPEQHRRRR